MILNEEYEPILAGYLENNKVQLDLFELLTILYPDRNTLNEMLPALNIVGSNFFIIHYDTNSDGNPEGAILEPCILDLQVNTQFNEEHASGVVTIKLGEADDNFEELYGGYTQNVDNVNFMFYMSIPYATPPIQSSTFSLRQPQVSPLSLEKTRQIFEQMRQQMLDNPTE
jgi:hypothetical protein